jgi:urea transport system ATP-binding protein
MTLNSALTLGPQPDDPDTRHGVVLYVEDVCVSFDGFKALNHLSLYLQQGELRCVIGPNGAGKTTMMDVITGKTRPDSGRVYFGQRDNLLTMAEHEIARAGICRKFQKPTVFEAQSVQDNLQLALKTDKGVWSSLRQSLNADQRDRIAEVAATIGLSESTAAIAGSLSHGQKQWLEIGMLLLQEPAVMLVDEPVAGMTHQEAEQTASLLTQLAGERSVLVVEHDMEFVRSLNSPITVLHEGSVLAEGSMDQVQNDPEVIRVYLGE